MATAQEARGYAGAALTLSTVGVHSISGGSPSTTYDNASSETWARGVTGEAGWFFKKSLAIGVEFTAPFARNELTSVRTYLVAPRSLTSRYREQTLFAVLGWHVGTPTRIRTVIVGGGGVVLGSSLERLAQHQGASSASVFGPYGDETSVSGGMLGATGGADVTIAMSRHLSVAPQVRVLTVMRGRISDSLFGDLGLPKVAYRIGLGVRANF